MPSRRRTTGLLVVVLVTAIAMGLLALIVSPVLRELRFTPASKDEALEVLEHTRLRFAGQVPIVRVTGSHGVPQLTVTHAPADSAPKPVRELLVLAYDPHDGQLVRTKVPLWVV